MSEKSNVSRRDFVKTGAVGAAALSVPMVLTSPLFAEDKPATPDAPPLRMGFIGLGKMGSSHYQRFVGYKDVAIVAVCDIDTVRREGAKQFIDEKYVEFERKAMKPVKEYKHYKELLDDKDIAAVLIAVPDHWHVAIAMDAVKAGKDVYCEKPLTLTIHEAKTLIECVRKHDKVFQVGSQQRTEGPFADAVDMIRAGRIGKIKEVQIGIGATSKPCGLFPEEPDKGLDWNEWLGQTPERPYNHILCQKGMPDGYPFNPGWRDYREFSGGNVTDWGAHHIDITHWALAMDQYGPVEARPPKRGMDTYGAELVYKKSPYGVEEVVVKHTEVVWQHDKKSKDGKPQEDAEEKNGIRFIGEKGEIFVNRSYLESKPEEIAKTPLTAEERKVERVMDPKGKSPHHQNWLDCIASRKRPIADVEVGARTVTACHLMNLAIWHDAKLNWDPEKWEFTGENAAIANPLRERPRRKKYELPSV